MPSACVHAAQGDPACELVVHHRRERKAGPQVPLTVMQCRTHRRAFTLYPLGHVPYGRLAVAPVTLDGQVLFSTEGEPAADDRRSPAWHATQLGAAFAAIDAPTVKLTDRRWWATQTPERLAQSAAQLIGTESVSDVTCNADRPRGDRGEMLAKTNWSRDTADLQTRWRAVEYPRRRKRRPRPSIPPPSLFWSLHSRRGEGFFRPSRDDGVRIGSALPEHLLQGTVRNSITELEARDGDGE